MHAVWQSESGMYVVIDVYALLCGDMLLGLLWYGVLPSVVIENVDDIIGYFEEM